MSKTITGAMPIRTVGLTPGHRWCGGLRSVKPAVNNGKGAPGLVHGSNSLNATYIRPGRISDRPRKLAKDLRNGHLASGSLAIMLSLHASRSTTPNQRGQIVRKPFPAGYYQKPTAELGKTERDPISTIGPSIQYVTESGDPVGKIKLLWTLASWCARTGGRQPFAEGATVPGCSWSRTTAIQT